MKKSFLIMSLCSNIPRRFSSYIINNMCRLNEDENNMLFRSRLFIISLHPKPNKTSLSVWTENSFDVSLCVKVFAGSIWNMSQYMKP